MVLGIAGTHCIHWSRGGVKAVERRHGIRALCGDLGLGPRPGSPLQVFRLEEEVAHPLPLRLREEVVAGDQVGHLRHAVGVVRYRVLDLAPQRTDLLGDVPAFLEDREVFGAQLPLAGRLGGDAV